MKDSQFNTLVQMSAALSDRLELLYGEVREIKANYVRREDLATALQEYPTKKDLAAALKEYPTKEDLAAALTGYPTKQDLTKTLEKYATKRDLEKYATKQDLTEMTDLILEAISTPFSALEK